MIKQFLFLLVACTATIRAQQPCLHAPQNPHSFAASPFSCAHYIVCIGGNTMIGDDLICPAGTLFDPPTQACGQTSCLECSPFGIQNLPHPDSCQQFVECIQGHRQIRTCPNGLMFDRRVGQCNTADQVVCPGDPPTEYPWDPTTDQWETTYDPWQPTTDPWETTPDPWETTTSPNPQLPICLPGQVHHAHPSDCTKYFICINGVLWSMNCPNNLHWNQRINTCDKPEHAGCIHGGGGGTTEPTLFPPADPWTEPILNPPNPK